MYLSVLGIHAFDVSYIYASKYIRNYLIIGVKMQACGRAVWRVKLLHCLQLKVLLQREREMKGMSFLGPEGQKAAHQRMERTCVD